MKYKYTPIAASSWMAKCFNCRLQRNSLGANLYRVKTKQLFCKKCIEKLEKDDSEFALGFQSTMKEGDYVYNS